MRALIAVVVIVVVGAAGAFLWAGRAAGPVIRITKPDKFAGAATPVEVVIDAPGAALTDAQVSFEQNGTKTTLWSQSAKASAGLAGDTQVSVGGNQVTVTRTLGRDSVPSLATGAGRIVVTASRPVLFGLRQARAEATHDVQVRLERPRVSVLSTKHYINLGGSEMVVYRVSPADVASGVRVGDVEYPGFPASGAIVDGAPATTDPAVRIAFFALLYDQDVNAPMYVFARDEAGNSARADFDHRSFPKAFKKSRIPIDDRFLDRVVPAILQGTTAIKPEGSMLEKFLAINGELRRKNAETIASFAPQTSPGMLWNGVVFHRFANTTVEAAFADFRTYVYDGKEIDHQVHLGFDLASYGGTTVVAADRGKVVFADELGIYGNCVIIDHGMGVQSLYGHLSVIDVKPGQMVDKDQPIGRSGMTGLAAGDHLHFTMLVNGHPVNPIEWWDPHWIQDRILRKLKDLK